MKVSEEDLRANFKALPIERLIALQAQGTLTETAQRIIEEVLDEQSVSVEARVAVAKSTKVEVENKEKLIASLASLSERFFAQLVDYVVLILICTIFFSAGLVVEIFITVGVITSLGYLLLADALPGGQSLGKRVLGIAVRDLQTNKPCNVGQSFLRNLLGLLFPVFDWIFIFGQMHQRAGDRAASTIVVRLSGPWTPEQRVARDE